MTAKPLTYTAPKRTRVLRMLDNRERLGTEITDDQILMQCSLQRGRMAEYLKAWGIEKEKPSEVDTSARDAKTVRRSRSPVIE